jgi:voltage-gated potassium channel
MILNAAGVLIEDTRSPAEIAWEKFTTIPLIILSFVFLVGYSILILDDEVYTRGFDAVVLIVLVVIWVMFIVDYFTRLALSTHKKTFLKRNIIDLVSLLIPFTRPFLLLMYLSRLKFFRGKKGTSVRARLIVYAGSFAILYIYVLSLAVYASERNAPGATITSYGDSVWWAIVTITTVGYGDMVPITIMGRIYASMLMLGGVVIVGAATGTFVSFLQERVQTAHKKSVAESEGHDGSELRP